MKKLNAGIALCWVLVCLTSLTSQAEIPDGYYNRLNGKKESGLKDACYQVIHSLTSISSYQDLPKYFMYTDVYPNTDQWWDMYSDIVLFAPSFAGLNREHSFPKSWWCGLTDVKAYTDLNHLYPSEMAANSAKSNYPLGVVDRSRKINFDNGVSLVGYPVMGQGGGAKFVFEPDDEYKGDFARTYFYMVTCYQDLVWNTKYMYMLEQNRYPTLNQWSVDLLLKWSREDPVSQKETDRNEVVYKFQNNRNPFIDQPSLAEYIWGDKVGEVFYTKDYSSNPDEMPNLIVPIEDLALDFGEVAINKSIVQQLYFKGENLFGDLLLSIESPQKDMFKLSTDKISTDLVNTPDGYWLNVTFSPKVLGVHEAVMTIDGGGIPLARKVLFKGSCLEKPVLHQCTALDALDVTPTSYLANWDVPDGDVVDYFVVTRAIYTKGDVVEQKLLAEENSLLVDDFDASDQESYYVQSSRLGYFSEPSNVVFVEHSAITGVETDQPLVVIGLVGGIRLQCSAPQNDLRIYDVTGKLVMVVDEVDNNTDIDLPLGVYLIQTEQSRAPKKVAVR